MVSVVTVHLDGDTEIDAHWHKAIDTGIVDIATKRSKGKAAVHKVSIFFRPVRPGTVSVVDAIIEGFTRLRQNLLVDCIACQGNGTWEEHDVGWDGEEVTVYTPCPECQGEGKVAPCRLPDEATST